MKTDALFDMCTAVNDVAVEAHKQGLETGKREGRQEVLNELRARCPYKEFCVQPVKCAGLGSCPRDPCCAD